MKHMLLILGGAAILLATVPANAADLVSGTSWGLISPKGSAALNPAVGGMLHVTVRTPLKTYYQIQLSHDVDAALPAGTTLRYQFLARSPSNNPIHAVIEKRTAPYTHLLDKLIKLTPVWKTYTFTTKVPSAYGPHGLAARLQVGQQAGGVEFKNIVVSKG